MNDPSESIKLFAAMAVGFIYQWVLFGPKKVAPWIAYGALGGTTLVCYLWATPTMFTDFQSNWRFALFGLIQFFLTAKGTGSVAAATPMAPKSNTL